METANEILTQYTKKPAINRWTVIKSDQRLRPLTPVAPSVGLYETDSFSPLQRKLMYKSTKEKRLSKRGRTKKYSDYDMLQYHTLPKYGPQPNYILAYQLFNPIKFESRYESGNLRKAIRVGFNEYDLYLDYDIGTKGYVLWYNFKIVSESDQTVKFNIKNMRRKVSLYKSGMSPLVNNSEHANEVQYISNGDCTYTLSFSLQLPISRPLQITHCLPYTFSDLDDYLQNLPVEIFRVENLWNTLAKNQCKIITATDDVQSYDQLWRKLIKKSGSFRVKLKGAGKHSMKKGVIITARVHPCESNSSHVMKGVLDFLQSDTREAKILRQNYIFMIVPMLNPDGVIYGNSRCSLLGVDLNRRWKNPSPQAHPTIFAAKQTFKAFTERHEVILYWDLHGHSAKEGAFMYCNTVKGTDDRKKSSNVLIKLFPMLLANINSNFSLDDWRYRIERYKENTSRVVMFKELGIINSYTLETSQWGGLDAKSYTAQEYEKLGHDLIKILLSMINTNVLQRKLKVIKRMVQKKDVKAKLDIRSEELREIESTTYPASLEHCMDQISELPDLISKLQFDNSDSESEDSWPSDDDEKRVEFAEKTVPKIQAKTSPKQLIPREASDPAPRLKQTPRPPSRSSLFSRIIQPIKLERRRASNMNPGDAKQFATFDASNSSSNQVAVPIKNFQMDVKNKKRKTVGNIVPQKMQYRLVRAQTPDTTMGHRQRQDSNKHQIKKDYINQRWLYRGDRYSDLNFINSFN